MQFKNAFHRIGRFFKHTLKETGLFFRFLITKTFLIHLAIAIVVLIAIFSGISVFLKSYTQHGESFPVPDFRGLKMEEVKDLASQKDLKYEVIDSVYNFTGRKGTIVEQTPPPGFKVKEGRTIFLTRQKYRRARVEVPSFVDISLSQARADIRSWGLHLQRVRYKKWDFDDLVLAQFYKGDTLKPGTKLPKGAGITLVVSVESTSKRTTVPSLIGLTSTIANSRAIDFKLNLGREKYDYTVKTRMDTVNARVWRQEPKPKSGAVHIGTPIDVYLTLSESKLDVGKLADELEK